MLFAFFTENIVSVVFIYEDLFPSIISRRTNGQSLRHFASSDRFGYEFRTDLSEEIVFVKARHLIHTNSCCIDCGNDYSIAHFVSSTTINKRQVRWNEILYVMILIQYVSLLLMLIKYWSQWSFFKTILLNPWCRVSVHRFFSRQPMCWLRVLNTIALRTNLDLIARIGLISDDVQAETEYEVILKNTKCDLRCTQEYK